MAVSTAGGPFPRLFEPFELAGRRIKNRIVAPPHAARLGYLTGTETEAAAYIGYWESIACGGTGWMICLNGFIENVIPIGFEPTGIGSRKRGHFRDPLFVERMGRLTSAIHAQGGFASTQMIMQGGMPHGPSATVSGPTINLVPHVLTICEIKAFVAEYAFSAKASLDAGLDGIELHANHDDLIEWFMSPLTNQRDDDYGGSFENRMRFLTEIIDAIRAAVGDRLVLGARLNMEQTEPGGFDEGGSLRIAEYLQDRCGIDYLHLVMGTGWGYPSYIQTHHFDPAHWREKAGRFRERLKLPIIYAGRVNSHEAAERVLEGGFADLVGVGRAHLADADFARKGREGRTFEIAPCIACNECISLPMTDALPFACTVNPALNRDTGPLEPAATPRRLLVIGGGPAGMQLAATARARGHQVELWERQSRLGGQMLLSSQLPTQGEFSGYIAFQQRRLEALGVDVRLGVDADAERVTAAAADIVAIATGAVPRRPSIPGIDDRRVHDAWQIIGGEVTPGHRVAVIVQDDHIAPMGLAHWLAERGHDVTMFIQTYVPAPLVSRYSMGTFLGRLSELDVKLVTTEAVAQIALPTITTRHSYSQKRTVYEGFDTVALACGGVSDSALFDSLEGRVPELHVLGDAYAPRRMIFATQQAHALGKAL